MSHIYDADALLILSIELAARRRPAALVDILAASELLNGAIPASAKLGEGFARLSGRGLIQAAEGAEGAEDAYVLHPRVQDILNALPRKADKEERLFTARELLADLKSLVGGKPAPVPTAEQFAAALAAHGATANLVGKKNLFMPKPESQATATKGPGVRQRKPLFKAAGGKGNAGKSGAGKGGAGKPAGNKSAPARTAAKAAPKPAAAPKVKPDGNAPLRRRKG